MTGPHVEAACQLAYDKRNLTCDELASLIGHHYAPLLKACWEELPRDSERRLQLAGYLEAVLGRYIHWEEGIDPLPCRGPRCAL